MTVTELPVKRTGGRVPPHNLDAEESLLGAMMLSKDAVAAAAEIGLTAGDFYQPWHAGLYDAIQVVSSQGDTADPVAVAEQLKRSGLPLDQTHEAALLAIYGTVPATSNAARYARIIQELALLRRLIAVAGEVAEIGYSVPDDVAAAVDRAEALVFDVAQRRVTDSMARMRDLLDLEMNHLELLYERGETITGLATGYHGLDELLAGLQPSTLNVIGARPATGKTAFAIGIASNVALTTGRPVLFFSLEMSHLELTQRVLSREAKVDATRMRTGRLAEADWMKLSHAIGRLADAPLYVDDNPHATVMEIRAKARRLRSQLGDLSLIVVDYLQLMTGRQKAENRQVEVAEISRGLKILARELEVPVVALSQLSRGLEQRADKRPMLSDLRESGSLEQDADVVMFLYRDELYNAESPDRGTCEVLVAKHRAGPTGMDRLAWLQSIASFTNMARNAE